MQGASPDTARDVAALLEQADESLDRKDWDEVSRLASRILEISPDHPEALGLMARVSRRRAQSEVSAALNLAGERRSVTVLFCDLVGSSTMAEKLDPEETQEILSWYHRVAGETVTAAGGMIARFMGDGVLVYFGYPNASADAPRQAVSAALSLLQRIEGRRAEIARTYRVDINARIGIHTGLAVIADMGGGNRREMADIIGETPNIAARLQAEADPGAILVSGETYALVARHFRAESIGARRLKNISRSIPAFRIVEARDGARDAGDAASLARPPIVGRSEEHRRLKAATDRVVAGTGVLLAITGEAGVGKSRLLELVTGGLAAGWPARTAACAPHWQSTPFFPIRRMLLEGGSANLQTAFGIRSGDYGSAAAERDAMLNAAVDWALNLARAGPALLALEDLHWSDPSTIEFLARLTRRIGERRLLALVSMRPELQPEWLDAPSVETLNLRPLQRPAIAKLARTLLGPASASPAVVDWIVERSGGVPLFAEELCRTLQEKGRLNLTRSDLAQLAFDIPLTLQGVLVGRLDRLGPGKRVAQVASVIGREFNVDLLRQILGADAQRLGRDLDDLLASGLVTPAGRPDSLMFKHALIRDAAYGSILNSDKRRIHAAIADALRERFGEILERNPEAVAIHLFEAQRFDEAAVQFEAAGRMAASRWAHSEAVSHLSMALTATLSGGDEPSKRERELQLRLALGRSLIAARGYGSQDVADNYHRARDLCGAAAGSRELFSAVHGLTAYYLVSEQIESAAELAESALDIATKRNDEADTVEAMAWLGSVRFFQGRGREAAATLDRAIAQYDAAFAVAGRPAALNPAILALSHRCWLHWLNGQPGAASAMAARMLDLAGSLGDPVSRAHGLNYRIALSVLMGDLASAKTWAREEIELARAVGLPHYEAYGMILLGWASAPDNAAAAVESVLAGLELRKATGAFLALPLHQCVLAEVKLASGDLGGAIDAVAAGREVAERTGELWWLPEIHRLGALVDHHAGREGVESQLRRGHRLALDAGATMLAARIADTATQILRELPAGDPLHPSQLGNRIEPDGPPMG